MGWMADETGLGKCEANYVPLTPLSHLNRAARVFADREALVYGDIRRTYAQYHTRVTQLASALARAGIASGDVVATLLPNIPAQSEAAFAVPACGGVLNTINTRLDVDTVAYIFDHGGAKAALVDSQFLPMVMQAVELMDGPAPLIIEVPDPVAGVPAIGEQIDYEDFIATGDPDFTWVMPSDEWESLALNYTSGTTGRPKGVVYHHRGAYLMTMGTPISWQLPLFIKYLQIVPLFHCNGWNHTWMMPALGGTVVCCRDVSARAVYDAIGDHGVTHFGGAPIVLNLIVNAKEEERRAFDHTVEVYTAGAPPAPATLAAVGKLGFNITQVYGLTETYGHVTECIWDDKWGALPADDQASIKAQQGVAFPMMEDITVVDDQMQQVTMDGSTQGEIVMRGNAVMKGFTKTHKPRRRHSQAAISIPKTSRSSIPTAICRSRIGPKTLSFPAAKTSARSRWKGRLCTMRRSTCALWWPNPMTNGAKCPVHSSNSKKAHQQTRPRLSPIPAPVLQVSNAQSGLFFRNCPRPRQVKSRNSNCG